MLRHIVNIFLIFGATILAICFYRASFMFHQKTVPKSCLNPKHDHRYISLKQNSLILARFKNALNIATVSYKPHNYDADKMLQFIDYLQLSEYQNITENQVLGSMKLIINQF